MGALQQTLFKVAGADLFALRHLAQTFVELAAQGFEVGVFGEGFIQLPDGVLIDLAGDQAVRRIGYHRGEADIGAELGG